MLEYDMRERDNVDGLAQLIGYKLRKSFQKSLRIVAVGQRSHKKDQLIQELIESFGVVRIDPRTVVKSVIEENTEVSKQLINLIENGALIGEDLLCTILKRQLN